MIVIMKPTATDDNIKKISQQIESQGLDVHLSRGTEVTIIGVVGDKTKLKGIDLEIADGVDKVVAVTESYKLANRKFHPEPTAVSLSSTQIGPESLTVMAGPCAVESFSQLLETAFAVKKAGARILRGGAFKPRTSPYSFQGLETEGLKYMKEARDATGLSVICEVTSPRAIEEAVKYVDLLQIGARNMQNFELLKEAGKTGLPVLLKRGLAATIDEWLNASEYIMSEGNPNVILCERGIRTFESATRNTLDLSAVPVLRQKTHLPVIVDPSHATGVRAYVAPMAKAAVAVGADGLMIEVHPCPEKALSDGPQSLTFREFESLMAELAPYAALEHRVI
ncbi:3-deoxy-D-arabinoheptulosonate-7-phosphate synthase [butyrate-producing bacterium SM4/1]|nr:3-deoxy-D-arabinoheptulosonate-7-phosphate synthase [butyrate-producing bacterium SM4/1]